MLLLGGLTLTGLRIGTDDAPEEGATVIVQVPALGSGPALPLSGPGLSGPAVLRVDGLPTDFTDTWAANHALFPRGVDLILCAERDLTALPRMTWAERG